VEDRRHIPQRRRLHRADIESSHMRVVTGSIGIPVVDNTAKGIGIPVKEAGNKYGMGAVKVTNGMGIPVVYVGAGVGPYEADDPPRKEATSTENAPEKS